MKKGFIVSGEMALPEKSPIKNVVKVTAVAADGATYRLYVEPGTFFPGQGIMAEITGSDIDHQKILASWRMPDSDPATVAQVWGSGDTEGARSDAPTGGCVHHKPVRVLVTMDSFGVGSVFSTDPDVEVSFFDYNVRAVTGDVEQALQTWPPQHQAEGDGVSPVSEAVMDALLINPDNDESFPGYNPAL